jgi:tmRNA-binding protein
MPSHIGVTLYDKRAEPPRKRAEKEKERHMKKEKIKKSPP